MIELQWNAPVSEAKLARYLDSLDLRTHSKVVDFGCGCGELLIRIHERFHVQGTGIDSSAENIAEAPRRAVIRVDGDAIQFIETDVRSYSVEQCSIDAAICTGATHAFGLGPNAFANAIATMATFVSPGGVLLVADGYLKQPKPKGYEQYVGDEMPDAITHSANVVAGQKAGLVALAAWTSDEKEWDEFEWAYQRIIERLAEQSPDDVNIQEKLRMRRGWMDAYLKWGRQTLGYGTYLFRKPM